MQDKLFNTPEQTPEDKTKAMRIMLIKQEAQKLLQAVESVSSIATNMRTGILHGKGNEHLRYPCNQIISRMKEIKEYYNQLAYQVSRDEQLNQQATT